MNNSSEKFFTRWSASEGTRIEVMKRGDKVVLESGHEQTGITRIPLSPSEAMALSLMLSYKAREVVLEKGL